VSYSNVTPTPSQRAALLAACWTAHDANWFAVVAASLGIETANRLSQAAAHAQGRFEAQQVIRLFGLRPVVTLDDWLAVQALLFGLLAPGVVRHDVEYVDEATCRIHVTRCQVHERAAGTGTAPPHACGVAARVAGWLQGLDVGYALGPCYEGCPLARGERCVYTLTLRRGHAAAPPAA
jgi:hypothetical protein